MQNNSQKRGKEGEDAAKEYLLKSGYKILETNWRFKKLEIDIIAQQDLEVVFVEVKARESNAFGEPELFVSKKKQGFLVAAAHQYLVKHDITLEARFDIIAITGNGLTQQVKHLQSAFYPALK